MMNFSWVAMTVILLYLSLEENKDLPEIENRTDNIISDIQIRENEIEDILHTLDPQKASGPDRISYKMLKISPDKNSKTT
jgi:hypothetical protein